MRVGKSRWIALGLMVALLWAAPLSWAGVTPAAEHGITGWFQMLVVHVQDWVSQTAEWFTVSENEEPTGSVTNEEVGPELKEPPQNEINGNIEPFG